MGIGKYYGTWEYVSYSLTWIGINVLPNFLYVSSLIYNALETDHEMLNLYYFGI